MIEFFDSDYCNGTASLYENHITFSKNMIKYLSDAYKARVGLDKEHRQIFVYPLNKDTASSGEFPQSSLLSISLAKSYARICSKPLLNYICSVFNIDIKKDEYVRYTAKYDDSRKAIKIEIGGKE